MVSRRLASQGANPMDVEVSKVYSHDQGWSFDQFEPPLDLDQMLLLLRQHVHLRPTLDIFIWKLTPLGMFTVSSAFDVVHQCAPVLTFRKLIWHSLLPSKVSIVIWCLVNRLLPFLDILAS